MPCWYSRYCAHRRADVDVPFYLANLPGPWWPGISFVDEPARRFASRKTLSAVPNFNRGCEQRFENVGYSARICGRNSANRCVLTYSAQVSRRPAAVTEPEIARAIRAAKKAGAAEVEVRVGEQARIFIRFALSTGPVDDDEEIVL
jgi:hypothetical protein